jgi:hypothetical protein
MKTHSKEILFMRKNVSLMPNDGKPHIKGFLRRKYKWVIQKKTLSILHRVILVHNQEALEEIKENRCKISLDNIHKLYRQRENKAKGEIPQNGVSPIFYLHNKIIVNKINLFIPFIIS